jgi:pyridoxal phosphate-dependent aminotransferase EpsN
MNANNNRIYLSPPHMSGDERKYIAEAFAGNWVAPLGPNVDAFERELAAHVGSKNAVALTSGTAAIHLALVLLGVNRGDTVFCSSLTFIASANPILYQGATPVFIDSEPESWNMAPGALERALIAAKKSGELPKALIVVNLYGQSADYRRIGEMADFYGIPIVEDAAESLGATCQGKSSGTWGKFGIFSFNGNKIINTSGGGMLVSDDASLIERARFLATQARDQALHYQHSVTGYNYRMSNILAGIGRGQLEVLEQRVKKKREIFLRYAAELGAIPEIAFMPEAGYGNSSRWLTVMTVAPDSLIRPQEIMEALAANNIDSRPVWKPLHLQPVFQECRYYPYKPGESVSERLFATGVCLPSGTNLSTLDQLRVIDTIKNTFKRSFRGGTNLAEHSDHGRRKRGTVLAEKPD